MRLKIEDKLSHPLPIYGGSPQGTLLGNLIFIVATSKIDKNIIYAESVQQQQERNSPQPDSQRRLEEVLSLSTSGESIVNETPPSDSESVIYFKSSRTNRTLDTSDESSTSTDSIIEHQEIRNQLIPEGWESGTPMVVKYVDDVLGSEKLFAPAGKSHLSTNKQKCSIHAFNSEIMIDSITLNAAKLGLKVNEKKTQMVCVSGSHTVHTGTFILEPRSGTKVLSSDEMKILGFNFSSKPTVDRHVDLMIRKAKKRLWLLRNLKNAKATRKDLLDSYTCFIRPIFDYCANVYHPMTTKQMDYDIEKLQTSALRIIYGYDKSSCELLDISGLPTHKERREELFNNFCKKIYNNPRFKEDWLQERTFVGPNIRNQKIIIEKYARTSRLFNSPLYAIRRKINDIYVN